MGKFNGKITAEFTPPRTWVLDKIKLEILELNHLETNYNFKKNN